MAVTKHKHIRNSKEEPIKGAPSVSMEGRAPQKGGVASELAAANAELNAIYTSIPIAMMLVDRDRRVRKVNQAAASFSRRQTEEIIGLRGGEALRCLHSLDDPEGCGFGPFCENCKIRQAVLATFNTGEPQIDVEAEFPFIHEGGEEERWLLVSTTLLRLNSTEMVLLCAQDITERKKAEEALHKAHDELEARVQERTRELRKANRALHAEVAERKQAEEALHKAHGELEMRVQERTRELQEIQKDLNRAQAVALTGSWRLDVQHDELLWSDENHRIFGIPRGTPMTYETFLASVHPEDREYVDRKWNAALEGEDYDIEHRIVVEDGVKWVREKAELEFDRQGMLKGGFGTTQDITERKQAEEVLRQTTDYLDNLFNYANAPIIVWSPEFKITRFNHAFERLTGRTADEVLGKKLDMLFPDDSRDESMRHIREATLGERLEVEEIPIKHKDGAVHILLWNSANLYAQDGKTTVATIAQGQDITERKKAEEQMAFQARLLDNIQDSVMVTDVEGRIIYWGGGTANMLGWQPEEVIGLNAADVLFPQESRREAEELGKLLTSGQSWSGEITVRRRDGTLIPFLARSSPVTDKDGKIIGIIAVGKDITELKKVDKMKDEFIGLVSHELRTPLTVATGSLRTALSEGISAEDRHDLLSNAAAATEELATVLENMLELSRYQVGRLQFHMEPVSIADVAQSVIKKLKGQGAGQRFLADFPDSLQPVLADSMRVERILCNLLENATKYSPARSEIKVSCRKEGDFIIAEVADRGNGISAVDQEKLFEPFQRLDTAPQTAKGIGLGLVVCKRLVEAQGGWIGVDSEVGSGSTFSFALPISGAKA